jgi:hypothetical protein
MWVRFLHDGPNMKTVEQRLFSKLIPITESGCFVYGGTLDKLYDGYGSIMIDGKKHKAHRVVWQLMYGEIPYGMEVLHSCDVKSCCNINHLRLGTHAENMKEASQRGLSRSGAQKLNSAAVEHIRNSKAKLKDLANLYQVSIASISRAKNGVHFK